MPRSSDGKPPARKSPKKSGKKSAGTPRIRAASPARATPHAAADGGAVASRDALLFLLRAGEALAASLDYRTTLAALVRESVPTIADWCAVDLLDESQQLKRLAVAHRDPAKIEMVRQIEARYPERRDSPTGSYARLAAKRTDWVPEITDAMIVAGARTPEHLAMIRALGLRSFISVPLLIRDRAVGLFTVVTAESERRYTESDVRVVEELARRASTAIDHARTHQMALDAAERLESQAIELEAQTEELRDAEHFARGVIESIADPMVVYDAQWRVRYENAAAARVFSAIGQRSMMGRSLWEEYPDLAGTAFEREMRRAMEQRTPTSFVERRRGGSVWTEVRCYPLPDGGIAAVWKDITEQKRAEQTLRYLSQASDILGSSLDFDATISSLAQLVVPELADWCSISVLEDDRIRMVAAAHRDPKKVELVRSLDARYPSDPNGDTQTAIAIRTGKPALIEHITDEMLDRTIKDPQYRELLRQLGFTSVITVPLSIGDRTLGAMSLVSMEGEAHGRLTEKNLELAKELARRAAIAVENARLYKEAVSSRRKAEEANAAKTTFLARMSHELRTPLNAIGGYAELLSLGIRGPVTPQQKADLDRIKNSQNHLLSLINDVLNYAKVDAGRLQYDVKTVAVAAALAEIEPLFTIQLQAKQMRYLLDEVDPALQVRADPERLQQIMLNLVSNAVKFTPDGGSVIVGARADGDMVDVVVRDTGRGIPTERLEAVFEPFVQLPFKGELTQGTGLGLAISRDLARGMGGDLVAQKSDGGATMVLRLHRAR